VAALAGAIGNPIGSLLIPLGLTRRYRQIGIIGAILIVSAFFIGIPYGAPGVAISYSIVSVLTVPPFWYMATKGTPVKFIDIIKTLAPSSISTIVSGSIAWVMFNLLAPQTGEVLGTIIALVIFGLIYLVMIVRAFAMGPFLMGVWREFVNKAE
ncbi:polysaccharide biosynthesis C-terminal domain-containing protein, partial [Pseudomonadota bacterium]